MYLFSDGFDGEYSVSADLAKGGWYSLNSFANITFSATSGRFGGGAVSMANNVSGNSMFTPIPSNIAALASTTANYAMWLYRAGRPGGNVFWLNMVGTSIMGSGNGTGFNSSGQLVGQNGPTLWSNTNICDGTWHWIEISYPGVGGFQQVLTWIDGSTAGRTGNTGVVSSAPGALSGAVMFPADATPIVIDDFIVFNDDADQTGDLTSSSMPLGGTNTQGRAGLRCSTSRPFAAGSNTAWTPDSGANYARVNEAVADDDTSYIEATASGTNDTYAFNLVLQTVNNPLMCVVKARHMNPDAGTINMRGLAYNGTLGASTSRAAKAAYSVNGYPLFRDPNANTWTLARANACEFGVGIP